MQSNGGVSMFLNTFLFIFLELISYICLYIDIYIFNTFSSVFGRGVPIA